MADNDAARRERLKKRGMPVPDSIGALNDIRWAASDDDWYIETDEGQVYWWNGKEWRFLPHGATR